MATLRKAVAERLIVTAVQYATIAAISLAVAATEVYVMSESLKEKFSAVVVALQKLRF